VGVFKFLQKLHGLAIINSLSVLSALVFDLIVVWALLVHVKLSMWLIGGPGEALAVTWFDSFGGSKA
jgi:hypothetical protein